MNDDLMAEAWTLTNGDRRDAYGDPREVFAAYGHVWSGILASKLRPGIFIDAADATLMMAALKICREANKVKRDNVVDAHGYLSLHSRVTGLLEEQPHTPTEDEWRDLGRPDDEIVQCTRPQPHDGPCNGWPCDARLVTIMVAGQPTRHLLSREGTLHDLLCTAAQLSQRSLAGAQWELRDGNGDLLWRDSDLERRAREVVTPGETYFLNSRAGVGG